ncbi:hypothetical protein [Chloroflexus sp.]|uniref:hypothetical protein n=1 Tax=Chloroflexus sp. TaxID=1904827 RepID=UPI002635E5B7|nr:hypothetical protein [uncultured Chloroflexus sp.]
MCQVAKQYIAPISPVTGCGNHPDTLRMRRQRPFRGVPGWAVLCRDGSYCAGMDRIVPGWAVL